MRFVWIGLIDEYEIAHELHVTTDAIPAALERGWMVLDDAVLGLTPVARNGEDGDSA
jgi:hypothetical protein